MTLTLVKSPEEELLNTFLQALEEELPLMIEQSSALDNEVFVEPFDELVIGETDFEWERVPCASLWINRIKQKIRDSFVECEEYELKIRACFYERDTPCVGFRYAHVMRTLFKQSPRIKGACDRALLESVTYFLGDRKARPSVSQCEYGVRIIREGF